MATDGAEFELLAREDAIRQSYEQRQYNVVTIKNPSEMNIEGVLQSARHVSAIEKIRLVNHTCQALYGTVLPLFHLCFKDIVSRPQPYIEDDSWLDEIDQDQFADEVGETELKEAEEQESSGSENLDDLMLMPATASSKEIRKPQISKMPVSTLSEKESRQKTPLGSFVRQLANFYGLSADIITPSQVKGTKVDAIDLIKQQQVHAWHCFQLVSEMLQRSSQPGDQELLASLFFFWGHQTLEQALTVECIEKNDPDKWGHSLGLLLSSLKLSTESRWVKHADKATFYARYPFCFSKAGDDNPLAVMANTKLGNGQGALKEFLETWKQWIDEALKIQIEAMTKDREVELKALQESAAAVKSQKTVDSYNSVNPDLSSLEVAEIASLEALLGEAVERLNRRVKEIHSSGSYSIWMFKRLQNVQYHLTFLFQLMRLFQRYPEPQFWLIHAQAGLLAAQYLAENLGALLALKQNVHFATHDLSVYSTCYGLSSSLRKEELQTLEGLNVKKGSEYLFKYFGKNKVVSPFMELLSELTVLSKSIVQYGEGFTPRGRKPQDIPALQKQLMEMFINLSQLSIKLVQIHMKED